jgi:hypothetical protein
MTTFTFLFLTTTAACGFFNYISMTPASDMAPNILTVTPLPVGKVPLAGVPFNERPKFLLNMQAKILIRRWKHNDRQKSKSCIASRCSPSPFANV